MRRFLGGVLILLSILVLITAMAAHFLPELWAILPESAVSRFVPQWWWQVAAAGGAVLLAGLFLALAGHGADDEADAQDGAEPPYRPDNEEIRARVRDLLRRAWGRPLMALLLGLLLLLAIHVPVHWFLTPFQTLWRAARQSVLAFHEQYGSDVMFSLGLVSTGVMPDFSELPAAFLKALPWLGLLLVAWLFVFQPLRVNRAGYFLHVLYGRKPSPIELFSVRQYARAVGGMALQALWITIWGLLALAAPIALVLGGNGLIVYYSGLQDVMNLQFMVVLQSGLAIGSVVWLIVFNLFWLNRCLAYCLTPCVLASQKNLPARRALRASRRLMRGRKIRMLGMGLSFLYYYLPCLAALILLPLVPPLAEVFGFTQFLTQSITRFLLIVIALNQLLTLYVAPIAYASFYALYLEIKRAFREDHPDKEYLIGHGSKKRDVPAAAPEPLKALPAARRSRPEVVLPTPETSAAPAEPDAE